MKRIFGVLSLILLIPVFVFLGSSNVVAKEGDNQVTFYMFWGDGCPHCARAKKELIPKLQEIKNLKIKEYEVFKNEENQKVLEEVGKELGKDAKSVPYIVVGDQVFSGYSEAISKKVIERIETCKKEHCEDKVANLVKNISSDYEDTNEDQKWTEENKESNKKTDNVGAVVLISILGLIIMALIYFLSNRKTKDNSKKKNQKNKE